MVFDINMLPPPLFILTDFEYILQFVLSHEGDKIWSVAPRMSAPPPSDAVWLWNFKIFWYSTKSRWVKCCWKVEISSILSLEHNSRIKKFLITELCSIPKKSGIVLNSRPLSSRDFGFHCTGNRAQFQVELWMGIELKGRNCGWELSSRDRIAEIYGSSQLEYLW